ncbi:MAG: hypothetical protein GX442_06210 [Candidatus Riflebacteria bacterium]|nr:hypothetical protein [Candidatus Riflebacteria bacterium]
MTRPIDPLMSRPQNRPTSRPLTTDPPRYGLMCRPLQLTPDHARNRPSSHPTDRPPDEPADRATNRQEDRPTRRARDRRRGGPPGPPDLHPRRSPLASAFLLATLLPAMAAFSGCSGQPARPLREENARLAEEIRVLGNKLDELAQLEADIREIRATTKQMQAEYDGLAASHPEAARRVREATMNR